MKKKTIRSKKPAATSVPPLAIIVTISVFVIIITAVLSPNPPAVLGAATQTEPGSFIGSIFSFFYWLLGR